MATLPSSFAQQLRQALEWQRAGRLEEAQRLLVQVIAAAPGVIEPVLALGVIHAQRGDLAGAAQMFRKAVAIDANHAEANFYLARALGDLGQLPEALTQYDAVLAREPRHAGALERSALIHFRQGHHDEALARLSRAVAAQSNVASAHFNRGLVLHAMDRFKEAAESFGHAARLNPKDFEALFSRAAALNQIGDYREALKCCDRAAALAPNRFEAHYNRASALAGLKRHGEAVAACDRALALNPNNAQAHNNRAVALLALGNTHDALASCARALRLDPNLADAHYNQAMSAWVLAQYDEALASIDHVLARKPDNGDAHFLRAAILGDLHRYREADEALATAQLHHYDAMRILSQRLNLQRNICDWTDFDARVAELSRRMSERDARPVDPLALAGVPISAAVQLANARKLARDIAGEEPTERRPQPVRRDRIRLGYFSGDFRDHPVGMLVAALLEHHDRSHFEVFAFSLAVPPRADDPLRARVMAGVDRFIDVSGETNEAIVRMAREIGIDIAIDLHGYTKYARTRIFAQHLAPIQVNFLGFPGTMGADFIDYMIGDPVVIPEAARRYYSENIVFLPHSYMPRDVGQPVADDPGRAAVGLPATGFVFCCFNNINKITPDTFRLWMRILARVDNSVLWLATERAEAISHLRQEAERGGVAPDRLIFAPRVADLAAHLARYRTADLFLDTLHYNAHTTAGDALWAGLPVLTHAGEAFASRVAASLNKAVGMEELSVASVDDYESLAVMLATQPERLAALRARLADNRRIRPLFDTALYARHLEDGYARMIERALARKAPSDIVVPAQGG